MPDAKRLSDEDIALLRSMPVRYSDLLTDGVLKSDAATWNRMKPLQDLSHTRWLEYGDHKDGGEFSYVLSRHGQALLATLDHHIEKTRREVLAEATAVLREVLAAHDAYSEERSMPTAKRYDEALNAADDYLAANPPTSPPIEGGA